jgi:hypothetical protein
MANESDTLRRVLSQDELGNLTQTIVVSERPSDEETAEHRPKVKYVATEATSVLKIMSGVVAALQQKGLPDKAEELRRLIMGGAYEEPGDALELIGNYVRLKIVTDENVVLGTIG